MSALLRGRVTRLLGLGSALACSGDDPPQGGPTGPGGPQATAACTVAFAATSGAPGEIVGVTPSADSITPATFYALVTTAGATDSLVSPLVHRLDQGPRAIGLLVPPHPRGLEASGPVTVTVKSGAGACAPVAFTISPPPPTSAGEAAAVFAQMDTIRLLQDRVLGLNVTSAAALPAVPSYLLGEALARRVAATGALQTPRAEYGKLSPAARLLIDDALRRAGARQAFARMIEQLRRLDTLEVGRRAAASPTTGITAGGGMNGVVGTARQRLPSLDAATMPLRAVRARPIIPAASPAQVSPAQVSALGCTAAPAFDGIALGDLNAFKHALHAQESATDVREVMAPWQAGVDATMIALLPSLLIPGAQPEVVSAEAILATISKAMSVGDFTLSTAEGLLPNGIAAIDAEISPVGGTHPPAAYSVDRVLVTPSSVGVNFSDVVSFGWEPVAKKLFGVDLSTAPWCRGREACDKTIEFLTEQWLPDLNTQFDNLLADWGLPNTVRLRYAPVDLGPPAVSFDLTVEPVGGGAPSARVEKDGRGSWRIVPLGPGDIELKLTSTDYVPGPKQEKRIRLRIMPDGTMSCLGERPSGAPVPEGTPNRGQSRGDPHLRTFDGLAYDFQAAGEFVLVESADGALVVQTRLEPVGSQRRVTINTAAAMSVAGDRVAFDLGRTPLLSVNAQPAQLPAGQLDLPKGGRVYRGGRAYVVVWPDNSQVHVYDGGAFLNVDVYPGAGRRGALRGLLGNYDSDAANDLVTRSGTRLSLPPAFATLYGDFAESWRVAERESLFEYAPGTSTATFTMRDVPAATVTASDLPDAARRAAEQVCREAGVVDARVLEDCALDVGLTGDARFAEGAGDALAPATTTRPVGGPAGGPAGGPIGEPAGGLLTLGRAVTGRIGAAGQIDTYSFTASAGQEVYVHAEAKDPGLTRVGVTLLDSDGKTVGLRSCFGCSDIGRMTLERAGIYRLQIGNATDTGTGAYTVAVFAVTRQTFEVSLDAVVTPDARGAGTIEQVGDLDVYRFSGRAGQEVFIDLEPVDPTLRLGGAALLSPSGTQVTSGCFGCTDPGRTTLPTTGEYRFEVGSARLPTTGRYRLGIYAVVRDSTAVSLNSTTPGRIEKPGNLDVYTFRATAGQRVTIDFSQVEPNLRLVGVSLRDEAGIVLRETCLGCTAPGTLTLTRGGTYTITIGSAREDGTGSYALNVRSP